MSSQEPDPFAQIAASLGEAGDQALQCLRDDRRLAEIVRVTLHLRGADRYQLIVSAKPRPHWQIEHGNEPAASSTAWSLLQKHQLPTEISLLTGEIDIHGLTGAEPSTAGADASRTIAQLVATGSTHLIALPLQPSPEGTLVGMVTFELIAQGALHLPLCSASWQSVSHLLNNAEGLRPEVAAQRSDPAHSGDPLLPVIGTEARRQLPMWRAFATQSDHLLITGPSGAGKSRLARWCHAQSPMRAGPFETIDFLSIPQEMQTAELVGWRKGAFTGAVEGHEGALSRADGGTLFIDEIDKLSLDVQAGLLQVLESGSFRPLASRGAPLVANCRILVGTNGDLPSMVAAGAFREDLFYRINVLAIHVQPLDARPDEIAAWSRFLLTEIAAEASREGPPPMLEDAAVVLLENRSWPGNLRQLANALRRAFAMATMDRGAGALTVRAAHVEQALAPEEPLQRSIDPGSPLESAADLIVSRMVESGGLDLDVTNGLRACVLLQAMERFDHDARRVYELLGRKHAIASRNHLRHLRQELARGAGFMESLGQPDLAERMRRELARLSGD